MLAELLEPVRTTVQPSNHAYLNGPWTPVHNEYDARDLEVVAGAIPDDLDGVYIRNTQNPAHQPLGFYHPFDGDGMLHQIEFCGGKANYRNRFVRTRGFAAEQEAGGSVWAGIVDSPSLSRRKGYGLTGAVKDSSNTDIVIHAGSALSTFYMCGEGYRLDPLTLKTIGVEGWVPIDGISAHTKVNEVTGELYFFNYSAHEPYVHYGVVDKDNQLVAYRPVPMPGPRMVHDFAFSANWAIFNDFPLMLDFSGQPLLVPGMNSRLGLVPRDASDGEPRWFDAAPTFVQHWVNAYEEGDEVIIDGYFQEDPVPQPPEQYPANVAGMFGIIDAAAIRTKLHRWRLNLADGTSREDHLYAGPRNVEFGMFNQRHAGQKYRYVWSVMMEPGMFLMSGWVKHDLETGQHTEFALPKGLYCSESPFVPKAGAVDEDDGYLVSFIIDENSQSSECWVLDAKNIVAGPIARLRLPQKISSGTHSCWASREQLGAAS